MAANPRRLLITLLLVVAAVGSLPHAVAQQAEDLGDYRVHYSAINTSQLSPEVARAFGIQRSTSRALLNLAVLRKRDDAMNEPTRARIQVEAVNIAGQRRDIEMREVTEQDAIYYIGTFRIHNEERVTFQIEVDPDDSSEPASSFRFQQQFFVY
ncbi:DUF4426 domain-containing protein [Wenzhouxiangella limi]|uniref:DUF4426 domain-containing protein n=1 Tax=Wenzhouxiangella limi TaxID=2707351 RepID=A0A845UUN5_9GAMM|nr:DUF4426 domain-containing protein [Wenzhouxiangella limi]NDY95543.1 DUF4426 domain-containing protein [Wenzhouxiangella limi]